MLPSHVCFVRCSRILILANTIFGTRRKDNGPIKLRKQCEVFSLHIPVPAVVNSYWHRLTTYAQTQAKLTMR